MSDTTSRSSALRWFQVRLPVIFLLGLLVAVFCGGYAAATRRVEETVKANREVEEKFRSLAQGRLDRIRAGKVIDLVWKLDALKNVGDLMPLLKVAR